MKTKIILHVGSYKTATTSIQGFFSNHRKPCARKFGVLYPVSAKRVNLGAGEDGAESYAHHSLAHVLRRIAVDRQLRDRAAALFDKVLHEIRESTCQTAFLSSELLSFIGGHEKEFICNALQEDNISVIYCVRNPVDFIESMNNQQLKGGKSRRNIERPIGFEKDIDGWIRLLGKDRVHVLAFPGVDITLFFRRFMGLIGDETFVDFACARLPKSNTSVSHEGWRLRHALDPVIPPSDAMDQRQRHAVASIFAEIDQARPQRTRLVTLDAAERRRVTEINASEMALISERFLAPEDAATILTPQTDWDAWPTNWNTPCAFDEQEVANALERLRGLAFTPTLAMGQEAPGSPARRRRRARARASR